jgi:type III pantothenate kinase
MLLLIDAGNSNVKWATIFPGQNTMKFGGVFSLLQPVENIIACFEESWGQFSPTNIKIGHVGSELFPKLFRSWVQAIWRIKPTYLKTEARRAGLVNGYSDPAQLGIDRWLALLAAHLYYKQANKALCIIDSGTCIKIDILTAEGMHLGGSILPGKAMMVQSVTDLLAQNGKIICTANKYGVEESGLTSQKIAQKNTLSGLVAGVNFSQVAVIEKLCRDLATELGEACQIVLTGGGGQILSALEPFDVIYSPHLVLKGIVAYSFPAIKSQKHVCKQPVSPVPA